MNITIRRSTLMDALHCATKAAPKKDALPILHNVAIVATAELVTLTMTDLDIAIRTTIEGAAIHELGAICVPAAPLSEVIAELPADAELCLAIKDYHLAISVLDSRFTSRIAGVDISEYPELPEPEGVVATVDKASLLKIIASVGFCVSRDQTRLALNGICITRDRRHAHAVATDGHRLGRMDVKAWRFEEGAPAGEWIVPVQSLKAAAGMCQDDQTVLIHLGENAIFLKTQVCEGISAQVYSKTITGPYPNWRQVVRPTSPHSAVFFRDTLMSALRRAIAVAKGPSPKVLITISSDPFRASLESRGPEGLLREGTETIPVRLETDGLPETFACNPQYLEEIISLCPCPEIRIAIDAPLRGLQFTPAMDVSDQFWLLMPLRLDERKVEARS